MVTFPAHLKIFSPAKLCISSEFIWMRVMMPLLYWLASSFPSVPSGVRIGTKHGPSFLLIVHFIGRYPEERLLDKILLTALLCTHWRYFDILQPSYACFFSVSHTHTNTHTHTKYCYSPNSILFKSKRQFA